MVHPCIFFQSGAKVCSATWELRTVLTNKPVMKLKWHLLLNVHFGCLVIPENVDVSTVLLVFTEAKEKILFHIKKDK